MNIENIAALAAQLQQLGFREMGTLLVKRICFKPDSFFVTHLIDKGDDKLQVELFFEKKKDEYDLKWYDIAIPQKSSSQLPEINGIHIASLENQMATVNWKQAFELNEQKPWNPKADFTNEETIEEVITGLAKLESSDEGKTVAATLKAKFWNGSNYQEIFGSITAPKNRVEISQRFFIFDGQPGISLDEAYRFLQNRRMEKQMKKKQTENCDAGTQNEEDAESSGNGLLKKKRISHSTKKGKHKITN
jgi:hypothetical protein